jgi:hypothetical protein
MGTPQKWYGDHKNRSGGGGRDTKPIKSCTLLHLYIRLINGFRKGG